MTKQGAIYFVGAGPGDTGLITVKGLNLLQEADAIVADTLKQARLLQQAHPDAEQYDTVDRNGTGRNRDSSKTPAEIIRLLLELAGSGKIVVRLWDDDPFLAGQAISEIAETLAAGIRVAVVPGIPGAIAIPAYAGVPVLYGDDAASFAVIRDDAALSPDRTALAGIDTLVIMMQTGDRLAALTHQLQQAGRDPDTPALAVQHGTLPYQRQVRTRLAALAETIKKQNIEPPAVIVIGKVVELAGKLAWFKPGDQYPLLGKRVLVTRPTHQAAGFMADLRALGAEPISFPTIEICPVEDTRPLDKAIRHINRRIDEKPESQTDEKNNSPYNWLVLTSANGVHAFWERLAHLGFDSRWLALLKIAAIGPATAEALRQRSIQPDLMPDVYTAEGILEAFDRLGPVTGQRFLLARADIARKTLAEGLVERGALVDEIAAYRTAPISGSSLPPPADIVTFTSSSTVQGYLNSLGQRAPKEALKNSQVVCIGPITAATARDLGLPVHAVAEAYTIEGLLKVLRSLSFREENSE